MPAVSSIIAQDRVEIDRLFVIVVGASLESEIWHRPLAYRLQELIDRWQEQYCDEDLVDPVVVSDIWYMSNSDLHRRPTISIGPPNANSLTAYLADKLPALFGVEQRLVIQADPTFRHRHVCLWGTNAAATAEALDAFADRYLEDMLKAVLIEQAETSACQSAPVQPDGPDASQSQPVDLPGPKAPASDPPQGSLSFAHENEEDGDDFWDDDEDAGGPEDPDSLERPDTDDESDRPA